MSVDDRFLEMFFEEARELLMVLEEGLMELESRQGDRAFVDKVFRSAHSIKGAAAMVGLSNVAGFTDKIETVLDKIRSQIIPADSDCISTLLESRDQLNALIESAVSGDVQNPPAALVARLEDLSKPPSERVQVIQASNSDQATAQPPIQSPTGVAAESTAEQNADSAAEEKKPAKSKRNRSKSKSKRERSESAAIKAAAMDQSSNSRNADSPAGPRDPGAGSKPSGDDEPKGYRIRFAPGREVFKRGMNPLGVLDELSELGEAFLRVDPTDVPTLESIDPQLNYLAWEIELHTDEPVSRIQDVFLFVGEDCRIEISELPVSGNRSEFEKISVIHGKPEIAPEAGTSLLPEEGQTKSELTSSFKDAEAVSSKPQAVTLLPAAPEEPTRTTSEIEKSILETGALVGKKQTDAANLGTSPTMLHPAGAEALSKVVRSASSRAAVSGQAVVGKSSATPRIRVDAAQLDDLVGLAGELAVLADNLQGLRELNGAEPYRLALESLERVCRQVRDQSLELRMVPVEELFSRFPRLVRDLADKSGKEIQLRIEGQETRLDRTIVERLAEPMIHLIRNSVDHGLETPEERVAAGKPRQGQVVLWAGHEGDRVALKIEDDGRGLNRARILEKGISRGLIAPNTSPDDPRVISLIFEPGFSTRDTVNELSGRGVGLDVVRDAVRALRGSVSVQSEPGRGTCFTFRLPLTLALIDGLLVEVAHERYVVPLSQVEECVALGGTRPALSSGRMCVSVRDELVPLVSLRKMFETISPTPKRQEILLTRHGGQRVGVAVDKLLGRVQAVIQSLGDGLSHLRRFSGATILGDGEVSLILDLSSIVGESRAAEVRADLARAMSQPEVIS